MKATLRPEEFDAISGYIHAISGIHLERTKTYLIENRLCGLLTAEGCSTFTELCHKARTDPLRLLEGKIIDAVTTGETLFFRDEAVFNLLRSKLIPELLRKRAASTPPGLPVPLRIWSAGCSTGQETYSLAMIVKELMLDSPKYSVKLVGTDISDAALHQARQGRYTVFETKRGLTPELLANYFTHGQHGWTIREDLCKLVTFKKLNLQEGLEGLGRFDLVMCRNVAIYFREDRRVALFDKLARILEPDGYLLIGSTESLGSASPHFEARHEKRCVYYRLRQGGNKETIVREAQRVAPNTKPTSAP